MRSPAERVRDAVAAWRSGRARARQSREEGAAVALARAHSFVAGQGAVDALAEADRLGIVDRAERDALAAHLAAARAEAILAPHRDRLKSELGRDLDVGGEPLSPQEALLLVAEETALERRASAARALEEAAARIVPSLLEARAEADLHVGVEAPRGLPVAPYEAGLGGGGLIWTPSSALVVAPAEAPPPVDSLAGPPHADAAPRAIALEAESFLAATDDLAGEAVGWLLGKKAEPRWRELAHRLRAAELDGLVPPARRLRRTAASLAALRIDRDLERVRVDGEQDRLDPRTSIVAVDPPSEVRMAPASMARGLLGELAAAEGIGRAVALAVVSPALPVAFRHPLAASVSRATGTLFAQWLADPAFLTRERGVAAREAERAGRTVAVVLLVVARTAAAATLVRADPGARPAEAAVRLEQALRVEVPAPLAALLALTPSGGPDRFRGMRAGLALHVALRERFDEDWSRNPRAGEPLRAAWERGGTLSAETWHDELAAPAGAAAARLHELFPG